MRIVNKKLATIAAVVFTAGVAYADDDDDSVACPPPPAAQQPPPTAQPAQPAPQPTYETTSAPEVEEHPGAHLLAGVGASISAGGGVDDFAGDTMRGLTGVGGSWNVRFVLGTRSYVSGEVSYIGSSQSIHGPAFNNSSLVGNGAQAGLRLNATDSYPVQPFIYGAAAWRHYSFTNNIDSNDNTDDVFELPVGVGVAAYVAGIALDVRGEYRFAWGSDMPIIGAANVDRWGVTGNIGLEF